MVSFYVHQHIENDEIEFVSGEDSEYEHLPDSCELPVDEDNHDKNLNKAEFPSIGDDSDIQPKINGDGKMSLFISSKFAAQNSIANITSADDVDGDQDQDGDVELFTLMDKM